MKKIIFCMLFATVLVVVSSCTKNEKATVPDEIKEVSLDQAEPLTIAEINRIIESELDRKGDFDWNNASELVLWSALQHAEGVLTIGYGSNDDDFIVDNSGKQSVFKNAIVETVRTMEGAAKTATDKDEDILIFEDAYLTVLDMKVLQRETIAELRSNKNIRYLEPSGYPYFQKGTEKTALSDSGCGFEADNVSATDYTPISPNALMPWNFPLHRIDDAWALSTGSGITIGIVDTGISPDQNLLNGSFNNGDSTGRTVEKYGVYVDSFWPWSRKTDGPNDKCGHGTSMTSAATAPRNNIGLPVGVAYNANLVSYRASSDVLLNGYQEQKGVAKAITDLGRRGDVKIISMSMGYIYAINRIKDAIRYAHSRGKLIFCAGGTSTSFTNFLGVVFPASMSETVAVTGIEEGSGYEECDACHKGSTIDFTMIMERGNNNHIPVLGYFNGTDDYVGGSSVATANAAGIAALVWSRNPTWTRNQVLNKLTVTADLYPNRSGSFGWGNLDAFKAVQ